MSEPQQLSLFGAAPAAPERPAPVAGPVVAPVAPPAPAADTWSRPDADRRIVLGEVEVGYTLTRVRRRSIGMVVGPDGLSVRAPRWVRIADIEAALREKAAWIRSRLHEQRERARKLASSRIEWADGAGVPFLGETVILVLDPRVTGAILHTEAEALPGVPRLTLHLGVAQHASVAQIRDTTQAWLHRQARRVFEERVRLFEAQLGVRVKRIGLSSAQTRWGSASADGSIRLNWRLIHFAMPTIDYVVAHELAHLRHMDHGPQFWDVVRSVIPDLEHHKAQLRDPVVPLAD